MFAEQTKIKVAERPLCDRCKRRRRMSGIRFCPDCRDSVIKQMLSTGYLLPESLRASACEKRRRAFQESREVRVSMRSILKRKGFISAVPPEERCNGRARFGPTQEERELKAIYREGKQREKRRETEMQLARLVKSRWRPAESV